MHLHKRRQFYWRCHVTNAWVIARFVNEPRRPAATARSRSAPRVASPARCCDHGPFVRSDKPKTFRGLQIKYVRGSDPVLKLLDDNGNIAEELSILKWNTDSVEEFLGEKLERI
ncbi:hypothetical protein SKAU_G00202060 [Synaphobranchus kaupii]|uniref:Selenoprotein F n=1 Tax=Synaphobranchus kaupii TaxID=118154 RepID=A0A9Q1IW75_SYNKA|nr:hypothetical protein SKAU_G00202060 [Synaphobranchus kaupii]